MSTIAYVVNSLTVGGTERLVSQMSRAFAETHKILVICLDELGLWGQQLRKDGFTVYCCWRQPGIDLQVSRQIAVICKRHDVDIIHAHQCTAWFYSALSRFFYPRVKILFEEHGRHYPEVYSWKRYWVNRLLIQRLTHKVVAVSKDVKERVIKYEGVSTDKISVIYNGVIPPPLSSEKKLLLYREELGLKADDFIIGTVGRLDPIKNYGMLLRAFSQFLTKIKSGKLVIVGDGPDYKTLTDLADQLEIADDVIFTGFREDAGDVIHCFDLFILCSFSEGTSMALLEAMSANVPAVVTRVGGNPELIKDRENGWVVSSDNTDELVAALLAASADQEKLKLYGQKSLQFFKENFTFDKMIFQYDTIYQSLVQGSR